MGTLGKTLVSKNLWKNEYQPKDMDEILTLMDSDFADGETATLKNMKPNQYTIFETSRTVNGLNKAIKRLKEKGLDIGKDNCEYGYKMPLPKEGELKTLIIFRRHY